VSQQWLLFRFTCRVLRMNCFWLTAHLFFQLLRDSHVLSFVGSEPRYALILVLFNAARAGCSS
jgi:hypothetical protein